MLARRLINGSVEADAAESKGHNAMSDREYIVEIMADHDHCDPSGGDALNQVQGGAPLAHPKRRSRFIKLNETMRVYGGSGNGNRLALSAG